MKPPAAPPPARPQATIMLSRVAHSLYWMSRYIERAENTARLLDVSLQFLSDLHDSAPARLNTWESLILSAGEEKQFAELYGAADSRTVTEFLAFDLRHPGSILSCVYAARENARMVRDQISLEMWETINELHLLLKAHNTAAVWAANPQEFFAKISRASHLFQGLTASTYSRSEGWEFIEFGKYLERADKTTRILDVKYHLLLPNPTDVGGALDTAQWQAVLRSASALEAYRRYYVREILPWKAPSFSSSPTPSRAPSTSASRRSTTSCAASSAKRAPAPAPPPVAPAAACWRKSSRSPSPMSCSAACTSSSAKSRAPSPPSATKS
jgi:uncharacterized alpha-E superfamily protein